MNKKTPFLIGAHTSIAGGVQNALYQGQEIGATTIQMFTTNQKRWDSKPFTPEIKNFWEEAVGKTGLTHIMSHDSYLINLGSNKPEILEKSRNAFRMELERCQALNISYLNFHPGAYTDGECGDCLKIIAESILQIEDLAKKGKTRLLIEATAGQGSSVGHSFEHLAEILKGVGNRVPMGVCIDTCHIFVAGYDIRTKAGFDQTLKQFDDIVGLQNLYAFHLNDSLKGLGSKVDRHAHLGKGMIGWEAFEFLVEDPRTSHLPMYLETPEGPSVWKEEIAKLKEMYANAH